MEMPWDSPPLIPLLDYWAPILVNYPHSRWQTDSMARSTKDSLLHIKINKVSIVLLIELSF